MRNPKTTIAIDAQAALASDAEALREQLGSYQSLIDEYRSVVIALRICASIDSRDASSRGTSALTNLKSNPSD